jgi:hypothetical protein
MDACSFVSNVRYLDAFVLFAARATLRSDETPSRTRSPIAWTLSAIELRTCSPLAGANKIAKPIPTPTPAKRLTTFRTVWSSGLYRSCA